ncbi:MAG TPA: HDIG domain-containing protein [Gemmatimonadaceae bacterium]|nr:HDIG domain-containing protein [Gemmatimonadaceae bacterium]
MALRPQPKPPDILPVREGHGGRVVYHGLRIGLLVVLAVLTYLLFPSAPAVDSPIFEVGSVATDNVIAPFAFTVKKTDAELARERDELSRSVKPLFNFRQAALDSAEQELRAFMDSIAATSDRPGHGRPGSPAERTAIEQSASSLGVTLTTPEADYLSYAARRRGMEDGLRRAMARWLSAGVAASAEIDDLHGEVIIRHGSDEHATLADSLPTFGSFLGQARALQPDANSSVANGLYVKLLSAFFHPTIRLDRVATESRRQELRNSVDVNQYTVRAGEKIVGAHEVVGKAEFDKMRALHDAMQSRASGQRAVGRIAGSVAYNALVLAIFGIAIVLFRPQLYRSFRSLTLFGAVFLIVLAAAALAARWQPVHPELVPVALAAIILSVLFDSRISMIGAMILAVLVGGQSVYRGTNALFINLVGGAAAALSVRVILRREQSYQYVITIGVAYLCAALAIGLTLGWTASSIASSAGLGIANAVVSVVFAMFLVPLAERFTGITTPLTLIEYSDLNRPLLRRLSLEAPGTYAHTIAMANLVEAACNAIGANGLLARVGTYYHDIGKLKKPQFFVENQAGGRNPHDKLKPSTSASIIRNHVREGVELAAEHHIPAAIAAFIPEHHGTASIAYFLEKARERDGGTSPNTAEFVYPGPTPQSAETAICMLADGVEASVRVLQEPTAPRIREVIDRIVRLRMEQGQLRDAPLTLRQIEIVKEQFARVLTGMYHSRIDYPVASGGITSETASG